MTNLLGTTCTNFYQNRSSFIEDMTKTSWCIGFSSKCSCTYLLT